MSKWSDEQAREAYYETPSGLGNDGFPVSDTVKAGRAILDLRERAEKAERERDALSARLGFVESQREKAEQRCAALEAALNVERIAALEHEQWMQWAHSLMASESISASRRDRWNALMVPYSELSEEMKDHDRKWARLVVGDALSGDTSALREMLHQVAGAVWAEAAPAREVDVNLLTNIAKRVMEGR